MKFPNNSFDGKESVTYRQKRLLLNPLAVSPVKLADKA